MRCAAAHCENEIPAAGRGRPPMYCTDPECRRARNAARQRKHKAKSPPVRPHRDRPGVHAAGLKDEQLLVGLNGMDADEWRAQLRADALADAELEAWERPKTIRCVTCREDIGKSVRLGPVEWSDELYVEAVPHGGNGWRCFDCDRSALLAEQQRILEAAQQRG